MGITRKNGTNRSLFNMLKSRLSEDLSNISETKVEERKSGHKESRQVSFPHDIDQIKDEDEPQHQKEFRKVVQMICSAKATDNGQQLTLMVTFEDKKFKQLSFMVDPSETGTDIANELVYYGLINKVDKEKVAAKIDTHLIT